MGAVGHPCFRVKLLQNIPRTTSENTRLDYAYLDVTSRGALDSKCALLEQGQILLAVFPKVNLEKVIHSGNNNHIRTYQTAPVSHQTLC